MIVIFGRKALGKLKAEGIFRCPDCKAQRTYQLKGFKDYFSIFFIPLIPLKTLPDRLIYSGCQNSFLPGTIASNYQSNHGLKIKTSHGSITVSLADPGKRVMAYLVDIFLLFILNFPLAIGISKLPVEIQGYLPQNFIVVFLILWFSYFLLIENATKGQTIGKKIFSLQVISEAENIYLNPGASILRNLIKIISGPLLFVFLFTAKNKALHDLAADSIVINKRVIT